MYIYIYIYICMYIDKDVYMFMRIYTYIAHDVDERRLRQLEGSLPRAGLDPPPHSRTAADARIPRGRGFI